MAGSWALEPIEQVTLASLVADRLRELIVEGRLVPGQRLVESRIAEELDVSRSPVREALAALSREGLVESEGKRGSYVWRPTAHDVDEIISLRVMVESLAAEWLMARCDTATLNKLDALVEQGQEALSRKAYRELVRLDRAFHDLMVRAACHSRLYAIWEQISSQWEVLIYQRLRQDVVAIPITVVQDHRGMLESLREGDLSRLVALHDEINQRVCDEIKATMAPAHAG